MDRLYPWTFPALSTTRGALATGQQALRTGRRLGRVRRPKVLWDAVEGPWAVEGSESREAVWESFEGSFGVRDTAGCF